MKPNSLRRFSGGKADGSTTDDDAPEKEKEKYVLQIAVVDQQVSYIMGLLSLTMPASYKFDGKVHQPAHAIWQY